MANIINCAIALDEDKEFIYLKHYFEKALQGNSNEADPRNILAHWLGHMDLSQDYTDEEVISWVKYITYIMACAEMIKEKLEDDIFYTHKGEYKLLEVRVDGFSWPRLQFRPETDIRANWEDIDLCGVEINDAEFRQELKLPYNKKSIWLRDSLGNTAGEHLTIGDINKTSIEDFLDSIV